MLLIGCFYISVHYLELDTQAEGGILCQDQHGLNTIIYDGDQDIEWSKLSSGTAIQHFHTVSMPHKHHIMYAMNHDHRGS